MVSPQQQDESLAAATTKEFSTLLDAHACNICHDILSAPVALPCAHIFCSECVRRHLSTKSLCPHPTCRKPTTYMQLSPLREYDVSLGPLRRTKQKIEPAKLSGQERLVFLSRKACSRAQLLERLRTHDIPAHGGTDAIANRYNDFVLRWNANLDAGVPKSKKSIVAAVMAAERGTVKGSRRQRGTSSFFMRASPAESKGDLEVPIEGDDFATLVKKTRTRMERKRKLLKASQENGKRVCLTATKHDSKMRVSLQGNYPNDGDNGDELVSQPPDNDAPSRPDRTKQKLADGSKDDITSLQPGASNPLQNVQVSSQCLSIYHDVCGLNIAFNETKNNSGGSPSRPLVEGLQPNGRAIASGVPQGPMYSQTTPEKQTTPVGEEREAVTSGRQSAVNISMDQLHCADVFVQTSVLPTNPHSNPNPKSASPQSHLPAIVFRRPRVPDSSGSPLSYGKNLKTTSQEPSPQIPSSSNTQKESRYPSRRNPSDGSGDVGGLLSGAATPTIEQLERAERNRLAAIERRKRFYARQGLSQMRQPEL